MRIGFFGSIGLLGLAAAGCGDAPADTVDQCSRNLALPAGVATDILFVIDDSRSMQEEQEKVVAELGTFVEALVDGPVTNDFHVGVITTGVTQNGGVCGETPNLVRFDEESGRLQSFGDASILSPKDPAFLDTFASLVARGIDGSAQEMGLEAMRLALSEPLASGANAGFLRPGARLLVVVVSDEDDCSDPTATAVAVTNACEDVSCSSDADCEGEGNYCTPDLLNPQGPRSCVPNACETGEGRAKLAPVQEYVDFLRGLDDGMGRPRETFLAVIGPVDENGDPERCTGGSDEAYGIGVRYREAVELMGEQGYVDSICNADFGTALERIANLVEAPQRLDLPEAPADGRLLLLEIDRADAGTVRCRMGDGFQFHEARGDNPAAITLEGDCRLQHGDDLHLSLICAG